MKCTIITLLLIASMTSRDVRANDGEMQQSNPVKHNSTIPLGPMGTVKSVSGVKINGRALYGEDVLWRGDLIQAPYNTSARILLNTIGQINLTSGATIRIASTLSDRSNETARRILIASVIEGEINVRLQPEASAYIETPSSAISAYKGARFRLRVEDQQTLVDAFDGEVHVEPRQIQFSYYKLHPVEPDPLTGNVRRSAPRTTYVPPSQSKDLSVQAKKRDKPVRRSSKFAPSMDEPAKNLRIRFTLDPSTIGQLDPLETTTNEFGIATTNFTAGSNEAKARFIATVIENPVDRYVGKIVVGKKPGIFRLRNILIAAGAIGAGIIICCKPHSNPMKQDPPIIIEP